MSGATQHFNQLTEAEQERLVIVVEECGEVIQAASKVLRHGFESWNPLVQEGETNRQQLERELSHLLHAISRITEAKDVDGGRVVDRARSKPARIKPYLHHQEAKAHKP